MSVASPSDAGYDVTALQEMLDDYEWQVMQSESLDTSVDNAQYLSDCPEHVSDIVQNLMF